MATMSCRQQRRQESRRGKVLELQLQSELECRDPQGALVVHLLQVFMLQEALVVCLLCQIYIHHRGGELLRRRWAMTLKCEECGVHHLSRGEILQWTCHARRMLFPHRSSHHVVDDLLKTFLFLFICQEQRRRRATELPCIMAECVLSKLRLRRLEYLRQYRDQCRLVKDFNTVARRRVELGTKKQELSGQEVRKFVHQVILTGVSYIGTTTVEIHPE